MLSTAFHQGWEHLLREIVPDKGFRTDFTPGRAKSLRLTLENYAAGARQEWALAVFSDAGREALARYFTYHQRWLAGALDRLQQARMGNLPHERAASLMEHAESSLAQLLLHLRDNYPELFNEDLPAPAVIRLHTTQAWQATVDALQQSMQDNDDSPTGFVLDIARHLSAPSGSTRYTYRTLFYIAELLGRLASLLISCTGRTLTENVIETLLASNFNHLGFFSFCQQQLREKLERLSDGEAVTFLTEQQQHFLICMEHRQNPYDASWPPVYKMLYEWTREELAQTRENAGRRLAQEPAACKKMMINLPAAYLACLIRLCYQGNWSREASLTDIFKFTAAHFETRRMEQLSWRSLSKEYYSINQATAARVRDLLQQMIALLNRLYFPVWAAGYALIYFC